ncbi:MAG: hypothetical protein MMC33_001981 [Icmadophila ericetorum]|nr:hypothetical protein [Icmadophila ericetorum]
MGFATEPIPRHTLHPGQDGYRTPTIEDYQSSGRPGDHEYPSLLSSAIHRAHLTNSNHSIRETFDKFEGKVEEKLEKLAWKQRIKHFTWTFFTITMATGGIANVIYQVPFRFPGLTAIGYLFFVLNVVFFFINVSIISCRFWYYPATFRASFVHPTESLFIPAAVVSLGTIMINISQYTLHSTGKRLDEVALFLFWTHAATAIIASSGIYLLMWSTQTFTIAEMTPVWIFPAYPLLIMGPHAGVLAKQVSQPASLNIIIGGFTLQGIGFLVAFMIYASFIYRLMTQKLPTASLRPGMFVSVGPSAFTAASLINVSNSANIGLPADYMGNGALAAMVVKIIADWSALWLWGLAIWFFIISVGAQVSCLRHGNLTFAMTWFSFIFPNTALITSTFAVGKAFQSRGLQVIGCVLTVILILAYIGVCGAMVRALMRKQILWPQKGEDRCEGGFKCGDNSCETCNAAISAEAVMAKHWEAAFNRPNLV